MSEDLDLNKVTVEFLNQNIEKISNKGREIFKDAADTIRIRLPRTYKNYFASISERHSRSKSFFIRDESTYLYDFYVPLGVSWRKGSINKVGFQEISSLSPFLVISGVAGTGKSMMMRHLFLDAISLKEKVPVFLELRELNHTDQSLLEFFQDTLSSNHFDLDNAYIEKALKAGHFIFFLDGFDEVSLSKRRGISREIQQLAKNYDKNIIVISTRPDDEFSGWPSFMVLTIAPLTLEQACELLGKLPFDIELKAKFIRDLKTSLFEKHKSFLSNPLLLSIMLLTYGMSADIPNKLSVFYNQAYEALFQRHDALKNAYQRDRSTDMDIQDFAKVFAAFCLQTYDKRIFQFSRSEALGYLDQSQQILSFPFNSNKYLSDALQAVCLLIEDGLLISFAHRSFQEYFVARFIRDAKPNILQKLIDKYSKNLGRDNVLILLYEMNPELVERALIIPTIEKLERLMGYKKSLGITHYTRFIKHEISRITFSAETLLSITGHSGGLRFYNIIEFTLIAGGHLIGISKRSGDFPTMKLREEYKKIAECFQMGANLKQFVITISKLSYKDDFIKEFALGDHIYSKYILESVLEIKKALLRKHQAADNSLENILDI